MRSILFLGKLLIISSENYKTSFLSYYTLNRMKKREEGERERGRGRERKGKREGEGKRERGRESEGGRERNISNHPDKQYLNKH